MDQVLFHFSFPWVPCALLMMAEPKGDNVFYSLWVGDEFQSSGEQKNLGFEAPCSMRRLVQKEQQMVRSCLYRAAGNFCRKSKVSRCLVLTNSTVIKPTVSHLPLKYSSPSSGPFCWQEYQELSYISEGTFLKIRYDQTISLLSILQETLMARKLPSPAKTFRIWPLPPCPFSSSKQI